MEKLPHSHEGGELLFLKRLREALDNKDINELRASVDYIQERVQRGGTQCSPMADTELREILETGRGIIYVGTGTSGQRIFIEGGEMSMPSSSEKDDELGRKYHLNFKALCDIPLDNEEMRIKF